MPTAEGLHPEIRECDDGSIIVQYKPSRSGTHEVQMSYEGSATEGMLIMKEKTTWLSFQMTILSR